MVWLFGFLLFLSTVLQRKANAYCSTEDDQELAKCLRPLTNLWQKLQIESGGFSNTSFTLYLYESNQLDQLCAEYESIKQSCLNATGSAVCKSMPLLRFVKTSFDYACNSLSTGNESNTTSTSQTEVSVAQRFRRDHACIKKALENSHCYSLLRSNGAFGLSQKNRCHNVKDFFFCAAFYIGSQCESSATTTFKESIREFGCEIERTTCNQRNTIEISTCLSNVVEKIQDMPRRIPTLANISFPLFLHRTQEINELCKAYHRARRFCYQDHIRKQCHANPLVQFVEGNLGFACKRNNQVFSQYYSCVSTIAKASSDCVELMRGSNSAKPSDQEVRCRVAPEYFHCMKDRVVDRCGNDGIQIFEDALPTFGCDELPKSKVQPEDVCKQHYDAGPCDSVFLRWRFNPDSTRCEKFVYGGCGGNQNNYDSFDDCVQSCRSCMISCYKDSRSFFSRRSPSSTSFDQRNGNITAEVLAAVSSRDGNITQITKMDDGFTTSDDCPNFTNCTDPRCKTTRTAAGCRMCVCTLNPPEDDLAATTESVTIFPEEFPSNDDTLSVSATTATTTTETERSVSGTTAQTASLSKPSTALPEPEPTPSQKGRTETTDERLPVVKTAATGISAKDIVQLAVAPNEVPLPLAEPPTVATTAITTTIPLSTVTPADETSTSATTTATSAPIISATSVTTNEPGPTNLPSPWQSCESLRTCNLQRCALIPTPTGCPTCTCIEQLLPLLLTFQSEKNQFPIFSSNPQSPTFQINPEELEHQLLLQQQFQQQQQHLRKHQKDQLRLQIQENQQAEVQRPTVLPIGVNPSSQDALTNEGRPNERILNIFGDFLQQTGDDVGSSITSRPALRVDAAGVRCPRLRNCSTDPRDGCIVITIRNGCQICSCSDPTARSRQQAADRPLTLAPRPTITTTPPPPPPRGRCNQFESRELGLCLDPLLSTWEQIRERNTKLETHTFVQFLYERHELQTLCSDYKWLHSQCYTKQILSACIDHPFITFTESLLSYACSPETTLQTFEHHNCIRDLTLQSSDCLKLIENGPYTPKTESTKCSSMQPYFLCMADSVVNTCGLNATKVFLESIEQFGCAVVTGRRLPSLFKRIPVATDRTGRPDALAVSQNVQAQASNFAANGFETPSARPPIGISSEVSRSVQSQIAGPPSINPDSVAREPIETAFAPFGANGPVLPAIFVPDELLRNETFKSIITSQFHSGIPPLADGPDVLEIPAEVLLDRIPQELRRNPAPLREKVLAAQPIGQAPSVNPVATTQQPVIVTASTIQPGCPAPVQTKIENCFQPVLDVFSRICRQNPRSNLRFPLFAFTKTEILDVCDAYAGAFLTCSGSEIRSCQEDLTLQFAVTNLGFACGRNVHDFFDHFQCISVVVKNSPRCTALIRNDDVNVNIHDVSAKCRGMPRFYSCIRNSVVQNCPKEGILVLQQSIAAFGCSFTS